MARRRAKRRNGGLFALGDILEGAYPGRAEDRPLLVTFAWWDRVVPPRIARNARPVDLRSGTLIVHTRSSTWAQELSFHEADLLKSIRARIKTVHRLRIRVGPMPPPPPEPKPPAPKIPPLPVTELPGDVARSLARVGDDRLRDALTKAACAVLAPVPEERAEKPRGRAPRAPS
jgi:hypothetical protein